MPFRFALDELRASAIFEVTEDLHQRAQDDWARYRCLVFVGENKFRDPSVLIEAERFKKKLAEESAKNSQEAGSNT